MTLDEKNQFLRGLSEVDFRELGSENLAYVRETEFNGKVHYAITTADGRAQSLAPNIESAMNAIQSSDLEPVTLH